MPNLYKPDLMEVVGVRQHTPDVKSFSLRFQDAERARQFNFRVGQFGIFSAFGAGESTFNICSSSNWRDHIEFCFRKVGRVTEALWQVEEGDTVGFRGPYGHGYPMEEWRGKDLIFLGGGIAMPPIRCAIWYALENRADYGKITVVYGARTVGDLVFVDELARVGSAPERAGDPAASIRAARRRIGTARSASCPRSSNAPRCRRTTPSRW